MKKQSVIMRIVIIFFSLLFCIFACISTVCGMGIGSVQNMFTADFWVDILVDESMPMGGVLNMIEGKDTYDENATLAQVTLQKLDQETIDAYNLTEDNLNELYTTSGLSDFVSKKMESAINAAIKGEVFELSSSEIVDVIKESEDDFTRITGVEMDPVDYEDLEQSIWNAGIKDIQHDFSKESSGDLALLEMVLNIPFDLIFYCVTGFFFLIIFLMNRRSKRRTLLYAGGVLTLCGAIFANVDKVISIVLETVKDMEASVKSVLNVVAHSLSSVGFIVMIVGIVLLAIYVGLVIFSIVMKIVRKRNRAASAEVSVSEVTDAAMQTEPEQCEPTETFAVEPVEEPVEEPMVEPVVEAVAEPAEEIVSESAAETVTESEA